MRISALCTFRPPLTYMYTETFKVLFPDAKRMKLSSVTESREEHIREMERVIQEFRDMHDAAYVTPTSRISVRTCVRRSSPTHWAREMSNMAKIDRA